MSKTIQDAENNHWVYQAPAKWQPYFQLARYDRPIGYWLLALPGWIGLVFATLSYGFTWHDLKWATLIFIGAIAMRGAGCTYNDIVDRDLDAQVERTALRPIPAGTVSTKQAWIWLFIQCFVGLIILLMLPRLAQIISLLSIPLVAAYPFMKRITWWPQVWLGLTFNWAVLVAYTAKTQTLSPALFVLYGGLVFWTVGYDTVYACQDIEDDAFVGIKSTARRFGENIKLGTAVSYIICITCMGLSFLVLEMNNFYTQKLWLIIPLGLFSTHLLAQVLRLDPKSSAGALSVFKSNRLAAFLLIFSGWILALLQAYEVFLT